MLNESGDMADGESKKELVVVVSGPSGVGKSTICQGVVRQLNDVYLSTSVTTRPKGPEEIDGEDYWYITREEFERRIENDELLEYAEVFGNLYGTPKDNVAEALEAGNTVILEIDVQGGKQAKALYPDAVMIFILAPTQKELAERMKSRGREDDQAAQERLSEADSEVAAAWQYYEHMVINEELAEAVREVVEIIKGARTRKQRAMGQQN